MRTLPATVTQLVTFYDAWIVGSAALDGADLTSVRDIDVLVPFDKWAEASLLIPKKAKPNTFRGWKYTDEGVEIDVWPGDLGRHFTNDMAKAAWHPRSGARLFKA